MRWAKNGPLQIREKPQRPQLSYCIEHFQCFIPSTREPLRCSLSQLGRGLSAGMRLASSSACSAEPMTQSSFKAQFAVSSRPIRVFFKGREHNVSLFVDQRMKGGR
jgi:hypothetical protein